jgi:hypothetical protein
MPSRYSAELRRFAISEATIYNWTKQEKIDRGELAGQSTEQALELAQAKRGRSRTGHSPRPRTLLPPWRSAALDSRRDGACR